MSALASPWAIDPGLAAAVAALVGWGPDDGPVALTGALAASVPSGSTAKLEAVAAGRAPPGADPEVVARRILADREAGRPEVAWSCWATSTLMAALLATLAPRPLAVAAIRRIDDTAPPVDVHSLVVVDGLLCDPYFSSVVAGAGAAEAERVHEGVWTRRVDEPDGRWTLEVGNGRWGSTLRYRLLAPSLDPGDVEALCVVSATHTGAPPRPFARIWRAAVGYEALTHAEGTAATRVWTWAAPDRIWEGTTEQVEHRTWAEAGARFAALTGIPLA